MSPTVRFECVARGRVQGVNYRARVFEAALRFGVAGSVENLHDGTVRIDVQGELDAVTAFLADISGRRGLSHAHEVHKVAEKPVSPDLTGFEIL